jgi:formylglycine-generating enzyme required for sulfatase activity
MVGCGGPSAPDVPPADVSLGDTWTRPADGAVMVYVPAGEFGMGSTEAQFQEAVSQCVDDGYNRNDCEALFGVEKPVHTVTLDGFWIDRYEVTNAQYAAFLNDQGNQTEGGVTWLDIEGDGCLIEQSDGEFRPKSGYADHPVICVSWYGARAYAEWVGGRLPTEAEWEYAARGPDGNVYPWGDDFDGARANFCDTNCTYDWGATEYDDGYERTAPVGSFPDGVSWCGVQDLVGNVWEWTRSLWGEDWQEPDFGYPYDPEDGRENLEAGNDVLRVSRGGAYYRRPRNVRCASRSGYDSDNRSWGHGFRVVVSP